MVSADDIHIADLNIIVIAVPVESCQYFVAIIIIRRQPDLHGARCCNIESVYPLIALYAHVARVGLAAGSILVIAKRRIGGIEPCGEFHLSGTIITATPESEIVCTLRQFPRK